MPDTSGTSTWPKVSASPIMSEAAMAPLTEPMPPMTTTTKQMMSTWLPMLGNTDESGELIMPAKAASAMPRANTSV